LWEYTLEAAIHRDPDAKKALEEAGRASARLKAATTKLGRGKSTNNVDRVTRDLTTTAVKSSIRAANIAATKALRAADVIVSTSTGAADPQLLAACGITMTADERVTLDTAADRTLAPDGLAPLSLPFVIVDEACQSVEPATLIPIVSSNSCRALVMLGDPCQLPPTVLNRESSDLTLSLMERLAATLPHPGIIPPLDTSMTKDDRHLESLAVKQAMSFLRSQSSDKYQRSYRKVYNGSVLLSIQYRMHPSIAALPSALFYNGLLATPDWIAENRVFPKSLQATMPCGADDMSVRLVDVGGPSNERQGIPKQLRQSGGAATPLDTEDQNSYWNEVEAERVISLVKEAMIDPTVASIGVISPYNGQVQLIKSLLAADPIVQDLLVKHPTSIEVKSVDGFQGRERDVIIFSAVRSNRNGRIGFLHDWRRMVSIDKSFDYRHVGSHHLVNRMSRSQEHGVDC
jgi:AAA domain